MRESLNQDRESSNQWNQNALHRQTLIEKGLTTLFYANNRNANPEMIRNKATMLNESLGGLATNKIEPFFKYLRENCDQLPSDGKIIKTLRETAQKFGKALGVPQIDHEKPFDNAERDVIKKDAERYPEYADLFNELLNNNEPYPSDDWKKRFFKRLNFAPSI